MSPMDLNKRGAVASTVCRRSGLGSHLGTDALAAVGRALILAFALVLALPAASFANDLSATPAEDEDATILVSNPPSDFVSVIKGMGFTVLEDTLLEDLGLHFFRVQGPDDQTVDASMEVLVARFPGLEVDRETDLDLNSMKLESDDRQVNP